MVGSLSRIGRTALNYDSDPIFLDLTIEILVRLPAKSLVKFQCVSKLWGSIIRRRDFVNSFLSLSSSRSYLLHFFYDNSNAYSFSANFGLIIPEKVNKSVRLNSLHGLLCFEDDSQIIICNPATRQLIPIPLYESKTLRPNKSFTCLGYDAIDDQYKVLRTSVGPRNGSKNDEMISEHHIFVLGARNSWRSIKGTIYHHHPRLREVYINGVLYYGAFTNIKNCKNSFVIVGFDVRSEEFNFIKAPAGVHNYWFTDTAILINHEEKVTLVEYLDLGFGLDNLYLWVLEDAQKAQWSKISRVIPPCWHDIAPSWDDCPQLSNFLYIQGTIHTGEIVMTLPGSLSNPSRKLSRRRDRNKVEKSSYPYVFYYDIKKNSIRMVKVEGLPAHDPFIEDHIILNCLDHLENIMFLDDCSLPGITPKTLREFHQ